MTLSEYTHLKQQIVVNVGKSDNHTHLLNKLKEFYKDDIDSDRRFEQIITIGQLLKILEIRYILSEENVGPLKEIARRLSDSELLKKICDYEGNHIAKEYVNQYVIENQPTATILENKENTFNNYAISEINSMKKHRIKETLVEEVGKYWRDLGRNLKIRECKIDEIDLKYNNVEDKTSELINLFFNKADKQRWFFVLCEALDKSRRKDLTKTLQEIMTMNM
ncbi:unnamed protein product [Euphydryas editha]|uniref:Fas-associated death domain protein n=1 Tax=Euphydryas editha TaxID=104508 RepID=A0AAU9V756_EUPED|nr:unnamed protein product [Euphydryas editha]